MKHYQPFYLINATEQIFVNADSKGWLFRKAIPLTFPVPDGTWETYQVVESAGNGRSASQISLRLNL